MFFYKLISKVLSNRLKVVLLFIISCNQSAFILGRLISYNILAAYETLHTMHTCMWSKVRSMGIKLDMSKTYDRVKWIFIETVMVKMGFDPKWVKLNMECVKSITYLVVINENLVGHIIPTRGLRQGDLLSSYLFLMCTKVLSVMLQRVESTKAITGVPTSKNGPQINHIFFVDDSLLFCKANLVEWRRITRILDKYEEASGQKLNKEKTSLFFSKNTSEERRREISQLFGLQDTRSYDKYLGLPTLIEKSRVHAFKGIKDRVWNCVNNWEVKFLSQVGKENQSKIHWISWERMGKAKDKGGLGFKDLVIFNKAILAKKNLENPPNKTLTLWWLEF
jgi:hypothetical protein